MLYTVLDGCPMCTVLSLRSSDALDNNLAACDVHGHPSSFSTNTVYSVHMSDTQRTRAAQRKSIRVHYRRYVHPSPDRACSSVHAGQRARHGAPSSASTASFPVLPSPLLSHRVQNVAVQGTDRLLYARRHSTLLNPFVSSAGAHRLQSTARCQHTPANDYEPSATRLWSSGRQPIAPSTVPLLSLRWCVGAPFRRVTVPSKSVVGARRLRVA
ncbi:hypothetical protein EXIGLDRAFT_481597 [Exidia glandulosa HHB12029]|uniref:Uncharacterized protein n=1 Tax=Exidia glandulosa HHB12029 TaxID=1314781 RepID=A0A165PH33_EXIGL|nr:hypothetical protein EXIGLDRAFT_481597 [Exidia glandulosa HHB12029]